MLRALALATLLLGCGPDVETVYVDPPVTIAGSTVVEAVPGDPALQVGFRRPERFESLQEGGPLWVIWGSQGGYWTMPALRVIGVGTPAVVECTVTTDGGEEVGRLATKMRFFPVPGFLEASAVPIHIRRAELETAELIDELYGVGAVLDCAVTDGEGSTAALALPVVITEG